jgi:hypothetical protein
MKWQTFRTILELVSFYLWILFTIVSISLAGLGIEGTVFAACMLLASGAQPVHLPLAMVAAGGLGVFLSIFWRQVGIDHFHYLQHDTAPFAEEEEKEAAGVLRELIRRVESSAGYARNDERAKAKAWLITHADFLDEEDILLAKTHFGYLLPAEWGFPSSG